MAEVLAELVARIIADATELKKALGESEKDIKGLGKTTEKETKSIKDRFLEIGKAATIIGAAITASMGLMIKSFAQTGSELLDLSLKTGVSVKSLAGLKYAAEQSGASLGTIEMAFRGVAIAMSGLKDGSEEQIKAFGKIGLSLKDLQGLNPEEQFIKLANTVAQVSDPFDKLTLATTFFGRSGRDMLPMLSEGADGLKRMMEEGQKASTWTTEMAKLADALGDSFGTLGTTTGGLVNTIVAALAPALKDIADALTGIVGDVIEWTEAHPGLVKAIGIATLVVGLLATAIGVATHAIKFFGTTANLYFGGILILIGALVIGIVLLIDWFDRAGAAQRKLADDQKAALEKQQADDKKYFDGRRADVRETSALVVLAIEKEYGASKDLSKSLIDQAYDIRDANIRAIDDEERAANQAHQNALSRAEDEYRLSLSKEERALQDQIDAIDAETEAEDKAARLAELQDRVTQARNADERLEAQQELDRYMLLQSREAEKDALRDKIQALRDETSEVVIELQRQRDASIDAANADLKNTLDNLAIKKAAEETSLAEKLTMLAEERDQKIEDEEKKLNSALRAIAKEEIERRKSYSTNLNDTIKWIEDMNKENAKLKNVEYTVTRREITLRSTVGGGAPQPDGPPPGWGPGPWEPGFTQGLAKGGIVTQPTLAMIGESGAEAVVPLSEMGGLTINFTQPVFFDREETMNRFIDKIRKGIQRQDRLKFGGAWNG